MHNLEATLFSQLPQIVQLHVHALAVVNGGNSAIDSCPLHFNSFFLVNK
jgi:hypothetical protein